MVMDKKRKRSVEARIRERALAQPEKRQNSGDDDDCADDVDDAVHEITFRVG
jgi:hypothetical protein